MFAGIVEISVFFVAMYTKLLYNYLDAYQAYIGEAAICILLAQKIMALTIFKFTKRIPSRKMARPKIEADLSGTLAPWRVSTTACRII
jgi:hypothetical protein